MIDRLKIWLGEDSLLDGAAWAVSFLLHIVVLLALALVLAEGLPRRNREAIFIEVPLSSEPEVPVFPEEIVVSDVSSAAGTDGSEGLEVAQAISPLFSDLVPVSIDAEIDLPTEIQSNEVLPAQVLDARVSVKGRVEGVSARGASGAMDILAAEIENSLDHRPTVVCWVFDQSISLVAQRKEIAARLDNVFRQINSGGLRNVVVSFGEKVNFVVKSPTNDTSVVVDAVENIPVDESGMEMTFGAIMAAAENAKAFRSNPRNNVMIVVFTDEVGNDASLADNASKYCRTAGIPVYVVGVPAPFGTRDVKIKYVEFDPDYQQGETWAVVNQGPESLFPEFVRLARDETVDSGFGPFHLSRICSETGGAYFRIHANSGSQGRVSNEDTAPMASQLRMFFDPETMRKYRPDYSSMERLGREIASNGAKKALVAAAADSSVSPIDSPQMVFPRKDDGTLAGLLSEAQKAAAKIQPRIDAICGVLLAGMKDRPRVQEARWIAGYDLSLGRMLATKVRADAYNLMLAQAKSGMKFKDKESDTWELVPSEKLSVGSQTEKIAKQAKTLLEKVVAEHPGTPWAYYAAQELRSPLGYEWMERHTGVNKEKEAAGNGAPSARPDDKKRMIAPPKPKRNMKNL
jgi:hypothetical protein